jgi:acyl-CoA thioesterase FadM
METYRGVVFPWLCDQQGHLTTSQYLLMFDQASYHFFDALTRDAGDPPELSWADVRHEIDYRAEVVVGALVLVVSTIERVGSKSLTARYVMTSTDRLTVFAELRATSVRFDKARRTGVVLSDAVRTAAIAFLAPQC